MANSISEISTIYSENLLTNFLTFNKDVDYTGWNVASGTGIGANDDTIHFKGDRSLYIYSTDNTEDFVINSGGVQTRFTASFSGINRYVLQYWVNVPALGNVSGEILTVSISKNGIGSFLDNTVDGSQIYAKDKWYGFWVEINLSSGDYIDFSFSIPSNAAAGDHALYVDGLKLEVDDKFIAAPTIYSEPPVQIPPTPADGIWYMDKTVGFNTWKNLALLLPTQLTIPIDFPSINAGEFYDYEYNASPLTFTQGQLMLVTSKDETNPALDIVFTAKRKGASGDASKIIIRAKNNTAAPVNLGATDFNIKIFP